MKRVILWVVRRIGVGTILTFALLALALSATAQGIAGLVRSLDNGLLFLSVSLSVALAWWLARMRASWWVTLLVLTGAGLGLVLVQVGQLGGKLAVLFQALVDLDAQVRSLWVIRTIDWQPLMVASNDIAASVITLVLRVRDWLAALLGNQATFDPVAATIAWSLVLWAMSAWAAWTLRRHRQVLPALLPSMALLALIYYYTGADVMLLVAPALLLLLLMVMVGHIHRESLWRAAHIDYSEDIRFDIALVVTPLTLLLVAGAWLAPSISVQQLAQLAQQALQEPARQAQPLPSSLGLPARPYAPDPLQKVRAPGLPQSHLIGSGPELSRELVMLISTGDLPPMPSYSSVQPIAPSRYYWRSTTYDRYIGSGWATADTQTIDYPAGTAILTTTLPAHRQVRQSVEVFADIGDSLYAAGQLMAADQEAQVVWRTHDDAFHTLFKTASKSYRADSWVAEATVDQLRSVRGEYPDWLRQRYLQLPDDAPQRVLTLARDLTATAPTPYDRAVAIEAYLRTYSYTLDLPAPPAGRDVADYFLFDLKKGYCDYFSASMVVLARAAGLPARLVVGYATGSYDGLNAQYRVTEADAHSWPEIYFGQYGWIEFEPTSGRAAIVRPNSALPQNATRQFEPLPIQRNRLSLVAWLIGLSLLFVVLVVVPGGFVVDRLIMARQPPDQAIQRLYQRVRRHGRGWMLRNATGATPYEYTATLVNRVAALAPRNWRNEVTHELTTSVAPLTDLYVRTLYSPYQPTSLDVRQAWRWWRVAYRELWLAWFRQWPRRLMPSWLTAWMERRSRT